MTFPLLSWCEPKGRCVATNRTLSWATFAGWTLLVGLSSPKRALAQTSQDEIAPEDKFHCESCTIFAIVGGSVLLSCLFLFGVCMPAYYSCLRPKILRKESGGAAYAANVHRPAQGTSLSSSKYCVSEAAQTCGMRGESIEPTSERPPGVEGPDWQKVWNAEKAAYYWRNTRSGVTIWEAADLDGAAPIPVKASESMNLAVSTGSRRLSPSNHYVASSGVLF
eukprot:TRINITY_DN47369_c0_g1_i1.p1 TRINITY_DN47369_c0_g1~~TRINITY_DN47369_c0_g1_i1.p1  ORF type:complete len:222 (-),score=20.77 TRINITY_DN47369_c0_g1_i1:336-1001(-)